MRWLSRIGSADLLTLANGFLGTLAITYILDGEHIIASLLILLAVIMDGLDGIVARRYGSPHEFGQFLDSISDAVSFCLAPGLIIYNNFYDKTLGTAWQSFPNALATVATLFFVVFGLLRLARFAGKDFRMKSFLGLPTPASAMLVIVLCLLWGNPELNPFSLSYEPYFIIGVIIALAFLMVSDVRYPKIRGKLAIVAGLNLILGIIPMLVYRIVPDYEAPVVELLIIFLLLLIVYILGGPVYEDYFRKLRKNINEIKLK
ncbi:MAG: CDP-diacylglycerol--serine O-phosphatidyltransferase [Thermoplasmata archaeon]|nr:CDP-diacylglycerol--serine O-phosphatidyltransferase [Thermoplasmata archaeon]